MLTVFAVFESLLEQPSLVFVLIALRYKMCYVIFKKENAVTDQTFLTFWREIGEYLRHVSDPAMLLIVPDLLSLCSDCLSFCELLATFQFSPRNFQANQMKQRITNKQTKNWPPQYYIVTTQNPKL